MYKCFIAFILLLVSSLSFAEFDPFADDGSSPPRDPVQYQIDLEKANRAAERAMREEQEPAPVPAPPTAARPQPRVLEPVTPSAPPVSRARPSTRSGSKNRTEYGMYGNWDAYKLNLADRQQCSVRQVYGDGSKVIVTQELAADGKHLWLYLQDKGSSFPPNYAGTVKVRIIGSGTVLYAEEAAVQNTTGNTVEMVRVTIEDRRFLSVLKLGMVMEVHWLDGSKIADRYRFGTGLPQALAAVNDQCVPTLALTQKQSSSGNGDSSGSSRSGSATNTDWKPPQWWVDLKAWAAKNQADAGNTSAPVKDVAKAEPKAQQKPSDSNTGDSYNGLIILGVLVGIFMLGTMLLPKGSSSEDSSGGGYSGDSSGSDYSSSEVVSTLETETEPSSLSTDEEKASGLFRETECKWCGSKEHSSSNCPHGFMTSRCGHCNSRDHATLDCPHDFPETECKWCGGKEHSSNFCPHPLYFEACSACGSREHTNADCPHSGFSNKCEHCGSHNHATNDCPH